MNGRRDGICPRCGVRPKEADGSYCPECRRKYQNEIRRKRKLTAPGICGHCGKHRTAPGKAWCQHCLNEAARAYHLRTRRKDVLAARFAELLAEADACRDIIAHRDKLVSNPVAASADGRLASGRSLPVKSLPVDPGKALEEMGDACRRRGYDPDMMLALARILPYIHFVKAKQNNTIRPVYRGFGKSRRGHYKLTRAV